MYLLFCVFRESVNPDARGGHWFAEAKFNAWFSHVLAVHGANGFHHTWYRSILTKRVAGASTTSFLDIDLNYSPEMFELVSELLLRHIFF